MSLDDMTDEENPMEGLKQVFSAMAGGDHCELCGSETEVELLTAKPLNPIEDSAQKAWVCNECKPKLEKHNTIADKVRDVLAITADGMAETYLADVEGVPLWGKVTVEDVTELDGVGPKRAESLREHGFETVEDIHQASINQLAEIEGITSRAAWDMKGSLKENAFKGALQEDEE